MSLKKLHEEFIRNSNVELPGVHRLPIKAVKSDTPLIPQNRWEVVKDSTGHAYMSKTFEFLSIHDRNMFIRDMLTYEEEFEHCSSMTTTDNSVTLVITTKSIGITEIDKDYARYADETFKDVTFNV